MVYANEFDKNARRTYQENFDIEVDPRDIREVKEVEVPDGDVLLAGFPCQPFSVAGYRKGFEDERGDLFFETLRIIIKKQPEVVFLENVKNMVTHNHGNTFKVIRQGLEQNGYYLKWKVMNAKDYGNVPQNRERIYIVGFKSKTAFNRFNFPGKIPLTNPLNKYIDFINAVDDKYYYSAKKNPTFYHKLEKAIKSQETVFQWRRQYVRENKNGVVPTLTANMGTGGHNVPLILSDLGIRKLTPRETFNIQGYPKTFKLPTDVANGQLYKQAGNSVVIPVIERIAKAIENAIQDTTISKNEQCEAYAVTYTKMEGRNYGESYVVSCFNNIQEANKYIKKQKEIPLITDEEYTHLVKKNHSIEFFYNKRYEINF